jgi:cyclopropane fatty-acyl-phospholipid synthase-like methyltransferase
MEGFDPMYEGTPPWEIGRPQPALRRSAERGEWRGNVLDVGCGTGEHALLAASLGLTATGIDASPRAIARAQAKAVERGLSVRFVQLNALELSALATTFETIVDSALFHVFSNEDRAKYVASVTAVTAPGSRYFLLCFSEHEPGDWGPRRVTQAEITASFRAPWRIDAIEATRLDVSNERGSVAAWIASMTRV